MAKLPFIQPEPISTPTSDKILDTVFGRVDGPDIDAILFPSMGGTGSSQLDTDIAVRVAMLDEGPEPFPEKLALWHENMRKMGGDALEARIRSTIEWKRLKMLEDSVTNYGDRGDIQGGVQAARATQQIDPQGPGYMEDLTKAALAEYERFGDNPVRRAQIMRDLKKSQLAAYMEQYGVLDKDGTINWTGNGMAGTKAVLGSVVPLRNFQDFTNVSEGLNPISGWNAFKKKIFAVNDPSLSPEQALALYSEELAKIAEETDNPFLFQERAEAFINPEARSQTKWGLLFDGVDLAGVLVKPANAARRGLQAVAQSRKPIRMLRDVGQTEKAGELAAAAARDGRIAEAARTTPEDAVMAASPFPGEEFDPNLVAGVAAETQKAIVDQVGGVRNTLKALWDRSLQITRPDFTEAEKAAREARFVDQMAGKAVVTARDETGFVADITVMRPKANRGHVRSVLSRILLDIDETENTINEAIKLEAAGTPGPENIDNLLQKKYWLQSTQEVELDNLRAERASLVEEVKDEMRLADDGGNPVGTDVKLDRIDAIDQILKDPRKSLDLDPLEPAMEPVVRKVKINYTEDDWGVPEVMEFAGSSRVLNSPSVVVHQMMRGVVGEMRLRDLSSATIANVYRDAVTKAYTGLGLQGRKNVDAILMAGDERKVRAFTVSELVAGIPTKAGLTRLKTVGEVRAYYAMREVADDLWRMENVRIKRDLEIGGYRAFKFADGETGFAKVTDPDEFTGTSYFDLAQNKIVQATKGEIDAAKNGGFHLYKMKLAKVDNGEEVTHVMARQSDLTDLPDRPLAYRPGYVPKVIDNVRLIGEVEEGIIKNGRPGTRRQVVQFFDNVTDAKAWRAAQLAKGSKVIVRTTNEWIKQGGNKADLEARMFGGLYDSKRSDKPVGWNGSGTEGERVGAYEALEAYANHVAATVPTHAFKHQLTVKFTKYAQSWSSKNLPENSHVLADPMDWSSEIILPPSMPEYKYFKAFQDWVKDQIRIPSSESRIWDQATTAVANWIAPQSRVGLLNASRDLISRGSLNMGQKDLTGAMRSMAFHATLGWFNPVQLYVQAMGAATVFALHPLKAMKLMGEYAMLRSTLMTKNGQVLLKTADAVELAGYGAKKRELIETARAYRKTGLWQNTKSTADAAALATGGDGIAMSAFKSIADQGLIFYREGERFNRTMAWLMAKDEFYKGKMPKTISDADIDAITKLSQKYSFNLDRSNRAAWQKGFLSVPTQFMQVQAKYLEQMWYGVNKLEAAWTPAEKLRVTAGMLAMFGAAGIPGGRWIASNLSAWATSKEEGGLGIEDTETIKKMEDGFIGFMTNWALDADVEVATRVSLPAGVGETLTSLFDDKVDLPRAAIGVFGEVPVRAFNILGRLAPLAYSFDEMDVNVVEEVFTETAMMMSTFRQARKAVLMSETQALWTSKSVDFNGTKIQQLDPDKVPHLAWAQALGFSPGALTDYYNIRTFNRLVQKDYEDTSGAIIQLMQRVANSNFYDGPKGPARFNTQMGLLMAGMTEKEKAKVMEMVRNRLSDNDYALANEIVKAADNLWLKDYDTTIGGPFTGASVELNNLGN